MSQSKPSPDLFDEPAWAELIHQVRDFAVGIRDLPVVPEADVHEIRSELVRRFPFDRPHALPELVRDVAHLLREWTVHVTHPRYFGLFNPSVRQAASIGEALAAVINPQIAAWSHAPGAAEMEQHTLRAFARLLSKKKDAFPSRTFTAGGAEANLSAVLVALADYFPEAAEGGLACLRERPALYVTDETHHSLVKIARMTGLGTDALRRVPTTDRHVMDIDALDARIRADRRHGWHPFFLVGTAGTTSAGLIDPLDAMADLAAEHDLFFHVDGAWGASAVLSPRLRPLLRGIERADSVTWDAHKWLSVPMGAGMFFCRHPDAVRAAFSVRTSYMPVTEDETILDPHQVTVQWTRRSIGFQVFMAVAELGLDGYRQQIEHQADMGDRLRERLAAAGFETVNDTRLPVVCFTHEAIRSGKIDTRTVLDHIYARRRVWISDVRLGGGEPVLRACITSFHTREADLEVLLEELESAFDAALAHA